jgi:DNA (cytosine-5)-methyltransferase 1
MTYQYYDFFAGGGMAGVGLGPGWTCAFANDFDARKADIYRANHDGGAEFTLGDVASVATNDLPGRPDMAWASFPCQDLSLAGAGRGLGGGRSGAFWPFWNLMRGLGDEGRAPALIVLENVYGALTSHGGADFAALAAAFADFGYRFGAVVINAVHFVPQSRPRLFIIGVRGDVALPPGCVSKGPSALWHPDKLIDIAGSLTPDAAANWLWWDVPAPPARNTSLSALIEDDPQGVDWRNDTEYLLSLMTPRHRAKVADAQRLSQQSGTRVVGTMFRRTRTAPDGQKHQRAEIRFDEVSGCLRTPSGGSSRQILLVVEGASIRSRLLSPREAARLMGLPDSYKLPNRANAALHLAGDGVAAPVVRHIAAHILEPILAENGARAAA